MSTVTIHGQPVQLRPLTVGDIGMLGADWVTALAALGRAETLRHDDLPTALAALLPCLACMTDRSRDDLAALALPELLALVRAAAEVYRHPFAPTRG